MWITMCKNSVYLVKKYKFIHKSSTLDEIINFKSVQNSRIINVLCRLFHKVIQAIFGLFKSFLGAFARFPHKLLLLLLPIKLNIINKTIKKRSFA